MFEHVAQFSDYMLRERGLSPLTATYRCRDIHEFLARIDEAGLRLDALTVAQVDELLARKVRDEGYARVSVQTYASNLRAFFRYAEGRGWCRAGLAAAIMSPRVFPYETLPAGLSWDDVNRALTAAQGNRPADIRDRALLMLLAVYGLRAGEVVGLRLEDFDWQREMLTVPHSKPQKPRTYPLCRPVGDAVLRYLREVRPRSARREVFLMLRAPFQPLTPDQPGAGRSPAASRPGRALASLWPPRLAACLCHALAGTRAVAEGNRRSPRAPVARDDPHLCQGRSVWGCEPSETSTWRACCEHQRSGHPLRDLPSHARGAVQDQRVHSPFVLPIGRAADACGRNRGRRSRRVLGRCRAGHQRMAHQVSRAEGVLPVCGQPWASERGPVADGPPKAAPAIRPVHLLAGRDPPFAGGDPVVPTLPHGHRTGDSAGDPVADLWSRLARCVRR